MEKQVSIDISGFRSTPDEAALGETWVAALETSAICFSILICMIGGYRALKKKPSGIIMFLCGGSGWVLLEIAMMITPGLHYNK